MEGLSHKRFILIDLNKTFATEMFKMPGQIGSFDTFDQAKEAMKKHGYGNYQIYDTMMRCVLYSGIGY